MINILKAVIFDLDGTLLNTLADLHASVNYALSAFGFPQRSLNEVRGFIGNGVKKLMQRATPENTDEKTNEACLSAFREHYLVHMRDSTAPYPNVIKLIEQLRENGVKIAVVSNKLHQAVFELCEDFFPALIDSAIGVETESERKPCPVNVFKAMERLGVTAEECYYVGDSEVDVQTAHNAGLKCIGVTWGFRDEKELRRADAEVVVNDCDELFKALMS